MTLALDYNLVRGGPGIYMPGVKPVVPVVIDWTHPLARGLSAWSVMTDRQIEVGAFGTGYNPEAAGASYQLKALVTPTDGLTMLTMFRCVNTASQRIFWLESEGSADYLSAHYYQANSKFSGGANGLYSSNGYAHANGDTEAVCFTAYLGTTGIYLNSYIDGEYNAQHGSTAALDQERFLVYVGGKQDNTDLAKYAIPFAFVWNRILSDAEIRAISRHPYQFLVPAG